MTDVGLLNLALSDLILAVSLPMWASHSQNIVSCKLLTGIYQVSALWALSSQNGISGLFQMTLVYY